MTDLAKNSTPKDNSLQPFIEALSSLRVKESPDNEVLKALSTGINKAIFNLGYTPKSDNDMEVTCRAILQDVRTFFSSLTLMEIILASHRGSLGYYGEFFGVNIASVTNWLHGMMGDIKRQEAKKSLIPVPEPLKNEVPVDEKRKLILKAFEKFKATGIYDDHGSLVYKYLKELKIIDYKGMEFKGYLIEAINQLISEKTEKKENSGDRGERARLKSDIEYLSQEEIPLNAEIEIKTKRVMLYRKFDELIFDEVDLLTIL